eukprot:gene18478-22049_t
MLLSNVRWVRCGYMKKRAELAELSGCQPFVLHAKDASGEVPNQPWRSWVTKLKQQAGQAKYSSEVCVPILSLEDVPKRWAFAQREKTYLYVMPWDSVTQELLEWPADHQAHKALKEPDRMLGLVHVRKRAGANRRNDRTAAEAGAAGRS